MSLTFTLKSVKKSSQNVLDGLTETEKQNKMKSMSLIELEKIFSQKNSWLLWFKPLDEEILCKLVDSTNSRILEHLQARISRTDSRQLQTKALHSSSTELRVSLASNNNLSENCLVALSEDSERAVLYKVAANPHVTKEMITNFLKRDDASAFFTNIVRNHNVDEDILVQVFERINIRTANRLEILVELFFHPNVPEKTLWEIYELAEQGDFSDYHLGYRLDGANLPLSMVNHIFDKHYNTPNDNSEKVLDALVGTMNCPDVIINQVYERYQKDTLNMLSKYKYSDEMFESLTQKVKAEHVKNFAMNPYINDESLIMLLRKHELFFNEIVNILKKKEKFKNFPDEWFTAI